MQVKLLRALQEGEVDPVGSKRPVKVDVRIISATNRDLGQMAKENTFREDLYYRLNVFPIMVPSLRDRTGDIAPLARHFIARFAAEENKSVAGLTPQAGQLLERFAWPGNVRQLENTIFRAVVLCDGALLDVCDFPQIAGAMGVGSGRPPELRSRRAGRQQRPRDCAGLTLFLVDHRSGRPHPQIRGDGIRNHPHGDQPL